MNVRVLGTRFNVFAYPGVEQNVVLVEGSVNVTGGKDSQIMSPGQSVSVKDGGLSRPVAVDVESYVSWVNNALTYEKEPLSSVFSRLGLYYGLEFEINCDIGHMYLSGKLMLSEDPVDVLSAIAFSVPVSLTVRGSRVIVAQEPEK